MKYEVTVTNNEGQGIMEIFESMASAFNFAFDYAAKNYRVVGCNLETSEIFFESFPGKAT